MHCYHLRLIPGSAIQLIFGYDATIKAAMFRVALGLVTNDNAFKTWSFNMLLRWAFKPIHIRLQYPH